MSMRSSSTGSTSRPVSSRNSRRSPSSGASASCRKPSGEVPVAEPRLASRAARAVRGLRARECPAPPGSSSPSTALRTTGRRDDPPPWRAARRSEGRSASRRADSRGSHDGTTCMKVVLLHSALGDSRLWRRPGRGARRTLSTSSPPICRAGAPSPLPTEPFSFVDVVADATAGRARRQLVRRRRSRSAPRSRTRTRSRGSCWSAPGCRTWDWTRGAA